MADTKLMLQLSRAEALVLFEFLARCEEAERFSFDDEAEQSVVWLIQAQLERATNGAPPTGLQRSLA